MIDHPNYSRLGEEMRAAQDNGPFSELFTKLKAAGKLRGKTGQFVLYGKHNELLEILPQERLSLAITKHADNLGGWRMIELDDAQ